MRCRGADSPGLILADIPIRSGAKPIVTIDTSRKSWNISVVRIPIVAPVVARIKANSPTWQIERLVTTEERAGRPHAIAAIVPVTYLMRMIAITSAPITTGWERR